MREQAMRQSGHIEKKKKEGDKKIREQKTKDVLARFMKRDA